MKRSLKADFTTVVGAMKPMHACGGGPRQGGAYLGTDLTDLFKEIGVPACRLHDIEGAYSMMQFVDVHNIFPDFDADENDHKSYNFGPTDEYLKAIKESGAKIFYRLGSSIEHFKRKLFIFPPKDYLKFARICEHIIRHYNYGWCQGQYWEIEHWEIWNEPESAGMWQGTYKEFYEFYSVVANHLKKCFPTLKIGGYSAVGFYTETRENVTNPWFKTIVPVLDGFMEYITAEETKAPLDFFSWHCYAENPEEVGKAARFIRKYLDDHGFGDIESYLTEYNTFDSLHTCPSTLSYYGAELAATLIVAQNSPIDTLYYYDLRIGAMNGVIARNIYFKPERLHGFYAMKGFGDLYRLKNQIKTDGGNDKVYLLGAADGENGAIMIAVRDFEGELEIEIKGGGDKYLVTESCYENITPTEIENSVNASKLTFSVKKDCIYYVSKIV